MNSLSFSQQLKPLVHENETDTFFCFNRHQSKILAKKLQAGFYADSINEILVSENTFLESALKRQSQIKSLLNNQLKIVEESNKHLKAHVHYLEKESKKAKKKHFRHKLLLGSGFVLMTFINAVK
jgi:hypothetical protein